ncbi:DUF547 domain-containing protein [Photobacterium sanctipauli]|uniref:DUF547 domain-containing protein n=1 Tax=Photobacterium sanctipauli TaxID=1342794 RepID=A0A2T3NIT7_9GAMM|nr:DUF547 domain-containing protein [Photobacterium sanctipauli]PSW15130.1 DUF547 domain-containing protein [Photobacterium sanctipauli]
MPRLLACLLLFFSSLVLAAPKADLWPYWQQHNASSQKVVDHQRWQVLLDKYLVVQPKQTLFRYKAVSDADKYELDRYLRDLGAVDPRQLNRREQFAYWVNLYNALTVQLILDNYPLKSITKLGGFFSFGPWDEKLVTVDGQKLSLNDIEHRILRPIWRDPRIHYAVNCASLGCPDLQPTVFTASNHQALLDKAANRFINSSKGVSPSGSSTRLSSIYDWYGSDFGSKRQLQAHINQYRQGSPVTLGKVSYDYNWSLNEAK